jgi:hypothetical protein
MKTDHFRELSAFRLVMCFQLKNQRLQGRLPIDNKILLKLTKLAGFTEPIRIQTIFGEIERKQANRMLMK